MFFVTSILGLFCFTAYDNAMINSLCQCSFFHKLSSSNHDKLIAHRLAWVSVFETSELILLALFAYPLAVHYYTTGRFLTTDANKDSVYEAIKLTARSLLLTLTIFIISSLVLVRVIPYFWPLYFYSTIMCTAVMFNVAVIVSSYKDQPLLLCARRI